MQIKFPVKCLVPTIAFLLLTVGCKKKEEVKATVAPPVKVEVAVIDGLEDVTGADSRRTYSGTVASSETTVVSFSVAGTIKELTVGEGQRVTKGQLLGKVTSGDYDNAHNIALAQLAEAQDAYNRLKKLHDQNALPDVKWVEIQEKLKEAQNEEQITRRTVSETSLNSPVTGTVSRKVANPGQNVAPGQPIYEIVSTEHLTIDISVPEGDISSITEGQAATIEFDELDLQPMQGTVTRKGVVADPLTRAYTVKVSVPANGKILPGMIGKVSLTPAAKPKAKRAESIVLPAEAVQLDSDNSHFVWLVKNGKAQRQTVTVNELVADGVVIEEGLLKGDTVIIEGMSKVGTGTRVTPEKK